MAFNFKYIVIDRMPLFDQKDRIVQQKVSPNIYDASLPMWILNCDKFQRKFSEKYNLVFQWNSDDNIFIKDIKLKTIQHRGMLFSLK